MVGGNDDGADGMLPVVAAATVPAAVGRNDVAVAAVETDAAVRGCGIGIGVVPTCKTHSHVRNTHTNINTAVKFNSAFAFGTLNGGTEEETHSRLPTKNWFA